MIKILIPLSGEGKRFEKSGYTDPKPFIPVVPGVTLIELVVQNLIPRDRSIQVEFIFVCKEEHIEKYKFNEMMQKKLDGIPFKIVSIKKPTEGAACSALLAKDFIDENSPLMIANCDQYIDTVCLNFWYMKVTSPANVDDGKVMSFFSNDKKWSYVRLDKDKNIIEVAEKKTISSWATAGIYWWKRGGDFLESAEKMMEKDFRVNGEFYIAPSFNEMILAGKHLGIFTIQPHEMKGLGTPEDLQKNIKIIF